MVLSSWFDIKNIDKLQCNGEGLGVKVQYIFMRKNSIQQNSKELKNILLFWGQEILYLTH